MITDSSPDTSERTDRATMTATLGSSFHVGPDDQPDKYRLLQQVGRGGEAQLWQGELAVAGGVEPVAIKIRTQSEGDFARSAQRWNEQAELLRFIRHPAVVGVREHFEGAHYHLRGQVAEARERALFLVMNWVDGVPLHEWALTHRDDPDRLRQALKHLEQVATVLDSLHAGGETPSRRPVIHGDLSPGNVMLLPTGQAMLVDFGLVRVVAHRTQRAAGTPGYAAPEVWHSGDYSPAADRYAFGALAWFALTGEAPSPRPDELRARLLALPLVAGLPPDQVGPLGAIVADRPEQRPDSLVDWCQLLRRGVLSSTGRPPGPAPSTWTGAHAVTGDPAAPPPTAPPRTVHPGAPQPGWPAPGGAHPGAPQPGWPSPGGAHPGAAQPGARNGGAPAGASRLGRTIGLVAAALAVAMIGGLVLGYRLFGGSAGTGPGSAAPVSPTIAPGPTPPPAPAPAPGPDGSDAAAPGATGTEVAPLPPSAFTVRRQTDVRIELARDYGVDLDSQATDWETSRSSQGQDLDFYSGGYLNARNNTELAPVPTATPDVATCQKPLPYYGSIELATLDLPAHYCVRTSEGRYAFLTVLAKTPTLVLDVTVWDPPRPS